MKRHSKNILFDKLHRGVVVTCLGLTLYGCYLLGVRTQYYFSVVRPERQLQEAKLKEQLLGEGKETLDIALELKN